MHRRPGPSGAPVLAGAAALVLAAPVPAYDFSDKLSINVLAATAIQCQQVSGDTDATNACRGAAPVQPEVLYAPTESDQIFVKLGLAAGNGLNPVSPFFLAPWAADLNADVKEINGRERSYLLEAWYAHSFRLGQDSMLQVTGGIIDPTYYVNESAYANDEYTQFMNEAFVNSRNAFLPAYDWGGVLVWKVGSWRFSGLGMNVGENEHGKNYNFYAAEADYSLDTALGPGNYRVMYSGTSKSDVSSDWQGVARRSALSFSLDQAIGKVVGVFLRVGWQAEDAAVDYKGVYSGGLDLRGTPWGREEDNIGIAYAHLDGGNIDIKRTDVGEVYYRLVANDHLALTADLQYMQDQYLDGTAVSGWIYGARAVVEF